MSLTQCEKELCERSCVEITSQSLESNAIHHLSHFPRISLKFMLRGSFRGDKGVVYSIN
jgi:hypothetical protein